MTQEHTITPPPELVEQWLENTRSQDCIGAYPANYEQLICTQAARWGADQELEACCEFEATVYSTDCADKLRRHRRPKSQSLKKAASEELRKISISPELGVSVQALDTIRRALESLPD